MGRGWKRIGVIARREYSATVRRREFLLITFGLPLLYVLIALVVGSATVSAAKSGAHREGRSQVVGFYDVSKSLNAAALSVKRDDFEGKIFPTEAEGQKAVRDKAVRAFVVVPADYVTTSRVRVYLPAAKGGTILSESNDDDGIETYIHRALLQGKVDDTTLKLALRPVRTLRYNFDPEKGIFDKPDPFRAISRFAVPYVFSLLLVFSVAFSSSYLLHGIVEEKENRVIEVLLSAATHEELLAGKLIGLGAVGLTQLLIWVSGGIVTAGFVARLVPAASFGINPGLIATALLMFLLGFAFNAALMAGVGAMGTSWRESQQVAGLAVTFLVIPLMFMAVLLEQPDGLLARVLSFIPLTAPIAMMLRIAAGGGSLWEVLLAAALLVGATWLTVRLSARLFRLSLLMYGQRPTPRDIFRYLTSKPSAG